MQGRKKSQKRHSRPVVEHMEQRQLLSGTVTVAVASGAMTITGDSADNAITIQDTGVGTFTIAGVNNTLISYGGSTAASKAITLATGNVTIDFSQGGNDTVTAANNLVLTDASGNHGNLIFNGGTTGNKSLFRAISATGIVAFMNAPTAVSEVVDITSDVAATGGTWTLQYGSNTPLSFNYDDTASTIQAALRADTGDTGLTVAGTGMDDSGAAALTITFSDTFGDALPFTIDTSSLTGATVAGTVTESTKGASVGAMAAGEIDLSDTNSAHAAGAITLVSQLVVGDRITLNDGAGHIKTLQAVASGATGLQFNIGADKVATMGNLVTLINSLNTSNTLKIAATNTSASGNATCTLQTVATGAAGNQAITVSSFSRTRITATGMTGGGATNVVAGDKVTLNDGVHTAVVFTFGTGATDVAIGASAIDSAANLAAAINAASNLTISAFDNGDGTISLYADGAGTGYVATAGGSNSSQISVTNFTGGSAWTNVNAGDTITLDDGINPTVTFTAVAGTPGAHEFQVGGDCVATMANFVAAVNAADDIGISAADNLDGTCTLTADATGVIGNNAIAFSGSNIAADAALSGGIGGSLEIQDFTVTMGNGSNYVGLGAGFAGGSLATGNVSITTGTGDDTVELLGAHVMGNTTIALGASATSAGDVLNITDEGTVASDLDGNLTVTQGIGMSTIKIASGPLIGSSVAIGGAVSINVGECAAGTAVTTLSNAYLDSSLAYVGGGGADTLNINNASVINGATTVTLGAGANTFAVTGGINIGMGVSTGNALTYTGGADADTVSIVATGTSEVQTITPSAAAASGTWTLTYDGQTTATLAWDATLTQIQQALRGLPGCSNVVVSGTNMTGTGGLVVTFGKTDGDVSAITANVGSLRTAANHTITAADVETTKGVATGKVNLYNPVAVYSADGTNSITIDDATIDGTLTIAPTATPTATGAPTGAGNDTVNLGATTFNAIGAVAITLGAGTNSLTMDNATLCSTFAYTGGAGGDTVSIGQNGTFTSRGATTLTMGGGANSATIDGRSKAVSYVGGSTSDALTMGAKAGSGGYQLDSDLIVSGITGTGSLTFDGYLRNLSYTGGVGADTILLGTDATEHTFLARGNVTIMAGNGSNGFTADNATILGALTYGTAAAVTAGTSGTGVDTITTGIDLSNALCTGLTVGKATAIYTGAANDVLGFNNTKFNTTSGTTSIMTGAGDDTITFDARGAGSKTYFYRGLTLVSGTGTTDTDVITDTTHTYYFSTTTATKPSLSGVRNTHTTVNGSTTGTLLGVMYLAPIYA